MMLVPSTRALLLAALVSTAALAGCVGDDESQALFESYDAAKAAVVHAYEPVNTTSELRLGLILPEDPQAVPSGTTSVVVLLYDDASDEPVTDAELELEAFMPAMGHGTSEETDPTHDAHGVYVGQTNLFMGGEWILNLDATLDDGTALAFEVDVVVSGGDGGMDGGMDGHGNATAPYGSYQEAQSAEGDTFEPENATNASLRLKLLEPHPRTNLSTGETNVSVLLFDDSTDEPVTEAQVSLEAFMPKMGHGSTEESDPVHTSHGMYVGMTTLTMEGGWLLNFNVTAANQTLAWSIPVAVGENATLPGDGGAAAEDYNQTFSDDVTSSDYARNWTFPVNATSGVANITLNVSSGSPLGGVTDSLDLAIFDANDTEIATASAGADETVSVEIDGFEMTGEYTARISGSGVGASYELTIQILYG